MKYRRHWTDEVVPARWPRSTRCGRCSRTSAWLKVSNHPKNFLDSMAETNIDWELWWHSGSSLLCGQGFESRSPRFFFRLLLPLSGSWFHRGRAFQYLSSWANTLDPCYLFKLSRTVLTVTLFLSDICLFLSLCACMWEWVCVRVWVYMCVCVTVCVSQFKQASIKNCCSAFS